MEDGNFAYLKRSDIRVAIDLASVSALLGGLVGVAIVGAQIGIHYRVTTRKRFRWVMQYKFN